MSRQAIARRVALGYLRVHSTDLPEVGTVLVADMFAHAEKEGLTLAEVCVDLLDPPAEGLEREGFCRLMDSLRRYSAHVVIIPTVDHLSRRPRSYLARRTIIEAEGQARLLLIYPGRDMA